MSFSFQSENAGAGARDDGESAADFRARRERPSGERDDALKKKKKKNKHRVLLGYFSLRERLDVLNFIFFGLLFGMGKNEGGNGGGEGGLGRNLFILRKGSWGWGF